MWQVRFAVCSRRADRGLGEGILMGEEKGSGRAGYESHQRGCISRSNACVLEGACAALEQSHSSLQCGPTWPGHQGPQSGPVQSSPEVCLSSVVTGLKQQVLELGQASPRLALKCAVPAAQMVRASINRRLTAVTLSVLKRAALEGGVTGGSSSGDGGLVERRVPRRARYHRYAPGLLWNRPCCPIGPRLLVACRMKNHIWQVNGWAYCMYGKQYQVFDLDWRRRELNSALGTIRVRT